MDQPLTKGQKISATLKKRFAEQGHHCTGTKGWKQSDEQKRNLSEKLRAHFARKGLKIKTDEEKRAANKANVYAYRARKRNAIPKDADLKLIKLIYEACPEGYHVDHIQALARGGLHHQDNLQYLPARENIRKNAGNLYDTNQVIRWQDTINQSVPQ